MKERTKRKKMKSKEGTIRKKRNEKWRKNENKLRKQKEGKAVVKKDITKESNEKRM